MPVPTVEEVKRAASRHFGVSILDIESDRRAKDIVRIRQITMTAAKRLTQSSLTQIGRRFKRDHTTVIHAVAKIEKALDEDAQICSDLAAIIGQFDTYEDIASRVDDASTRIVQVVTAGIEKFMGTAKSQPQIVYRVPPSEYGELLDAVAALEQDRFSAGEKRAIERVIALGKKASEALRVAA